jgi:hypothetical protein
VTPDELRPILTAYRKQVEQGWSKATAHPSYEGADGSPVGQCGVSSAWLQRRLLEDHGIATAYCYGAVYSNHRVVGADHCWLELGAGPDRLVIDVTADQMPGVSDFPVLYASHSELIRDDIAYRALGRGPSVTANGHGRLALLEAALS